MVEKRKHAGGRPSREVPLTQVSLRFDAETLRDLERIESHLRERLGVVSRAQAVSAAIREMARGLPSAEPTASFVSR